MADPRMLAVGDRIYAYPCEVTIEGMGAAVAHGRCASCEVEHVIDRHSYERGHGPWQPVRPDDCRHPHRPGWNANEMVPKCPDCGSWAP